METQDVDNFWSSLYRSSASQCWEWCGETKNGYGRVGINGCMYWTHRFAYWHSKGAIQSGLVVMHSCDNRRCCRPDHLTLGTPAENAADRERKGRGNQPRGAEVASAKLDDDKAQDILLRFWEGENRADLAREFNVTWYAVNALCTGKTWRHIHAKLRAQSTSSALAEPAEVG